MKCLDVTICTMPDAGAQSFFSQHYPALERLRYWPYSDSEERIDRLEIFLENHTALKHFQSTRPFFMANRDSLIGMNIQLDVLSAIYESCHRSVLQLNQFVDLLRGLHGRAAYKSLWLTFTDINASFDFRRFPSMGQYAHNIAGIGASRRR